MYVYNPMPYKNRSDLYKAQKRFRLKIRQQLYEYLVGKSCKNCGESDPVVLDFDHDSPSNKFKSVARMLSGHYSWGKIQKEIQKCTIRCANCHRRRPHNQFGYVGRTEKARKAMLQTFKKSVLSTIKAP
jgi:hypothetical protein